MRPPVFLFGSCPKRKTAPRPGLRVAAAGGRRRRPGISAAAPLAGCREAGPQRAMRQGGGRKKRALRAINCSVFDTMYARLPDLGADCIQVGKLSAPVSADGFASARAAACTENGDLVQSIVHALRGESKEGPKPLFVSFQLGKVKGGEEIEIFPSLVAFLLQLFFGQTKKS